MNKRLDIIPVLCTAVVVILLLTIHENLFGRSEPSSAELLNRKGFSWRTDQTEHFWIHYEANSFAEKQPELLTMPHERAIPRILELIGEQTYPEKIHIFAVESRARMKTLIGLETNGIAFPKHNIICCIFSEQTQAVGAHELMHVISLHRWGGMKKDRSWLSEGLAVYSDDNWRRYDLHALNKHLQHANQLVPLEQLLRSFHTLPDMIRYPESGSLVKFLCERYGRQKLKQLWQASRADVRQVYGKSPSELETEWHDVISIADASGIQYSVKSR